MKTTTLPIRDGLGRRAVVIAAAALFAGCASKKVGSPRDWPTVAMLDAELMPKLDANSVTRRTRVVVFQPQDSQANRGAGLAEVAAGALQTMLGAGGVEVVDRGLADKLDQELKLIELNDNGNGAAYSGDDVADFAITVAMGTASWGSQFNEGYQYKDNKGKVITIPASYTHNARSTMTVRIYELPSLRLAQSFPVDGSQSVSGQNVPATPQQGLNLMRRATESGIRGKRNEVLNEFSPKGYVVEHRKHPKKGSIFQVMLGKQSGAKTGDTVYVFRQEKNTNALTGRVTYNDLKIAEGVVSDVVGDTESWIFVDEEKEARKIRRGDVVKVKHGAGFWDSLIK